MNLKDAAAKSIVEATIEHPKTSVIVPWFVSLIGIATIQSWLTVISMLLGICAAVILIRHRWVSLQTAEIELKEARKRLKELEENEDRSQASTV